MMYDNYVNKIKRLAKIKNFIYKFRFVFISIIVIIIGLITSLMITNGNISKFELPDEIIYGDNIDAKSSAFMTKTNYQYRLKGENSWNEGLPESAGEYEVRAYSKATFGKKYSAIKVITINKKDLYLNLESTTIKYGSYPNVISKGLCDNDKINNYLFTYEDLTKTNTIVNLDLLAIKVVNSENEDVTNNYNIISEDHFDVNFSKLQTTIINNNTLTKTYDEKPINLDFTYNVVDFGFNDKLIWNNTFNIYDSENNLVENPIKAGRYRVEATGFDIVNDDNLSTLANYNVSNLLNDYVINQIEILRKDLTFKTNSHEWTYDDTDHEDNGYNEEEINNILIDDRIEVSDFNSIKEAGSIENYASINIFNTEDEDVTNCYNIRNNFGTLTINKKELVIKTSTKELTYTGVPQFDTEYELIEDTSIISSHLIKISSTYFGNEAGNYPNENKYKIVDQNNNDVSYNYNITYVYGDLIINKKPIDVNINITQEYKSANYTLNIYDNDKNYSSSEVTIKNIKYDNYNLNELDANTYNDSSLFTYEYTSKNYEINTFEIKIKINPIKLNFKLFDIEKTYDKEDIDYQSYRINNVKDEDDIKLVFKFYNLGTDEEVEKPIDAGIYLIYAEISDESLDKDNYYFNYTYSYYYDYTHGYSQNQLAELTIYPKEINITANNFNENNEKIYDGIELNTLYDFDNYNNFIEANDLVLGDQIKISGLGYIFNNYYHVSSTKNVGEYKYYASSITPDDNTNLNNYSITYKNNRITIVKKDIKLIIQNVDDDNIKIYDKKDIEPKYELDTGYSFVEGEDISYELLFKDKYRNIIDYNPHDVGTYYISINNDSYYLSIDGRGNYNLIFEELKFEIVKRDIKFIIDDLFVGNKKEYDKENIYPTFSVVEGYGLVDGDSDVTFDLLFKDSDNNVVDNPINVGNYLVTFNTDSEYLSTDGRGNYNLIFNPLSFEITPRVINTSIKDSVNQEKTFDNKDSIFSFDDVLIDNEIIDAYETKINYYIFSNDEYVLTSKIHYVGKYRIEYLIKFNKNIQNNYDINNCIIDYEIKDLEEHNLYLKYNNYLEEYEKTYDNKTIKTSSFELFLYLGGEYDYNEFTYILKIVEYTPFDEEVEYNLNDLEILNAGVYVIGIETLVDSHFFMNITQAEYENVQFVITIQQNALEINVRSINDKVYDAKELKYPDSFNNFDFSNNIYSKIDKSSRIKLVMNYYDEDDNLLESTKDARTYKYSVDLDNSIIYPVVNNNFKINYVYPTGESYGIFTITPYELVVIPYNYSSKPYDNIAYNSYEDEFNNGYTFNKAFLDNFKVNITFNIFHYDENDEKVIISNPKNAGTYYIEYKEITAEEGYNLNNYRFYNLDNLVSFDIYKINVILKPLTYESKTYDGIVVDDYDDDYGNYQYIAACNNELYTALDFSDFFKVSTTFIKKFTNSNKYFNIDYNPIDYGTYGIKINGYSLNDEIDNIGDIYNNLIISLESETSVTFEPFNINKKLITISIKEDTELSKEYSTDYISFDTNNLNIDGLVNVNDQIVYVIKFTEPNDTSTLYNIIKDAGTYRIEVQDFESENYYLEYDNNGRYYIGEYIITPIELSLKARNLEKAYDGYYLTLESTDFEYYEGESDKVLAGDDITVSFEYYNEAGVKQPLGAREVGNYTSKITKINNTNYVISDADTTGNITISEYDISLVLRNKEVTYGEFDNSSEVSIGYTKNTTDNYTFKFIIKNDINLDVGEYDLVVEIVTYSNGKKVTQLNNTKISITNTPKLIVKQKNISITKEITQNFKGTAYSEFNDNYIISSGLKITYDLLVVDSKQNPIDAINAGTYVLKPTNIKVYNSTTLDELDINNYNLKFTTKLVIKVATITLTIDKVTYNADIQFDLDADYSFNNTTNATKNDKIELVNISIPSFEVEYNFELSFTCATDLLSAKTHKLFATLLVNGEKSSNIKLNSTTYNFIINQKDYNIYTLNDTLTYNGEYQHGTSYNVNQLKNSLISGHYEVINEDKTASYLAASSYPNKIVFNIYDENGNDVSSNYNAKYQSIGNLVIKQKNITIVTANKVFKYNGQKQGVNKNIYSDCISSSEGLITGDEITDLVPEDSSKVKQVGDVVKNNFENYQIFNKKYNLDVTDSYNITWKYGNLSVEEADVIFSINPIYLQHDSVILIKSYIKFTTGEIYDKFDTSYIYQNNEYTNITDLPIGDYDVVVKIVITENASSYTEAEFNVSTTIHYSVIDLELTTPTGSYTYDGNPHSCTDFKPTMDNISPFLKGIRYSYVAIPNSYTVETEEGEYDNIVSYYVYAGEKNISDWFNLTYTYGKLRINSGYDISFNDYEYSAEDITYNDLLSLISVKDNDGNTYAVTSFTYDSIPVAKLPGEYSIKVNKISLDSSSIQYNKYIRFNIVKKELKIAFKPTMIKYDTLAHTISKYDIISATSGFDSNFIINNVIDNIVVNDNYYYTDIGTYINIEINDIILNSDYEDLYRINLLSKGTLIIQKGEINLEIIIKDVEPEDGYYNVEYGTPYEISFNINEPYEYLRDYIVLDCNYYTETGPYPVTARSCYLINNLDELYKINSITPASLIINPREITIICDDVTYQYDGLEHSVDENNYSFDNPEDEIYRKYINLYCTEENVGRHDISAKFSSNFYVSIKQINDGEGLRNPQMIIEQTYLDIVVGYVSREYSGSSQTEEIDYTIIDSKYHWLYNVLTMTATGLETGLYQVLNYDQAKYMFEFNITNNDNHYGFEITKLSVTIEVLDTIVTYDGNDQYAEFVCSLPEFKESFSINGTTYIDVGTYEITYEIINKNYNNIEFTVINNTATLTIEKFVIEVVLGRCKFTYDGLEHSFTPTNYYINNGDDELKNYITFEFDDTFINKGTYNNIEPTNITCDSNYDVSIIVLGTVEIV